MVEVKEDMTGWIMAEHGYLDSRLTVVAQAEDYISPQGKIYARWLCECSCKDHNHIIVLQSQLRKKEKYVKSCGCLKIESLRKRKGEKRTIQWKLNEYKLNLKDDRGLYGIGYCSNTKSEFYFDMDDYEKIKNITWYEKIRKDGFRKVAGTDRDTGEQVIMHILLGFKWCDHDDRNELNNRKYNLRVATKQDNSRNRNLQKNNTSGFVGVSLNKKSKTWRSYIMIDKRNINLGSYQNKKDAIRARLVAEKQYFGEFAPQRHLFKEYGIEDEFMEE